MNHLIPAGRTLLALALIGLGIEHFIFREFITGRAPAWPDSTAGGPAWACLTGIVIVATGVALIARWKPRYGALIAAGLIFAWAFLRQLPVAAADSLLAPTWTHAGKALTLFGGLFAVAGTLPRQGEGRENPVSRFVNLEREFIVLGRICLGTFLVITGIQHFIYTEFVASLVPGWIPGDPVLWTYFTGSALIAGGVGLNAPPTARLAALLSGLMVFSWFWIVHVPLTFDSRSSAIAVFEALAVSGIAFVLAGHDGKGGSSPAGLAS